jgi:hypothetical protein
MALAAIPVVSPRILGSYGIDIDKTLSFFHAWLKSFTRKYAKGTKEHQKEL